MVWTTFFLISVEQATLAQGRGGERRYLGEELEAVPYLIESREGPSLKWVGLDCVLD